MAVKILAVRDGRLMLTENGPNGEVLEELRTVEDVNAAMDAMAARGDTLMCSSSVDFPDESTDDQNVIELCRMIRPRGWLSNFAGGDE